MRSAKRTVLDEFKPCGVRRAHDRHPETSRSRGPLFRRRASLRRSFCPRREIWRRYESARAALCAPQHCVRGSDTILSIGRGSIRLFFSNVIVFALCSCNRKRDHKRGRLIKLAHFTGFSPLSGVWICRAYTFYAIFTRETHCDNRPSRATACRTNALLPFYRWVHCA